MSGHETNHLVNYLPFRYDDLPSVGGDVKTKIRSLKARVGTSNKKITKEPLQNQIELALPHCKPKR